MHKTPLTGHGFDGCPLSQEELRQMRHMKHIFEEQFVSAEGLLPLLPLARVYEARLALMGLGGGFLALGALAAYLVKTGVFS